MQYNQPKTQVQRWFHHTRSVTYNIPQKRHEQELNAVFSGIACVTVIHNSSYITDATVKSTYKQTNAYIVHLTNIL